MHINISLYVNFKNHYYSLINVKLYYSINLFQALAFSLNSYGIIIIGLAHILNLIYPNLTSSSSSFLPALYNTYPLPAAVACSLSVGGRNLSGKLVFFSASLLSQPSAALWSYIIFTNSLYVLKFLRVPLASFAKFSLNLFSQPLCRKMGNRR